MAFDDSNPHDINEDLHLHHLAVYGREAMHRIFDSNVLVMGMQGHGAEIAKNLILAGMKSVTLQDEGLVELWDLSGNFIFTEEDIGKNRAIASVKKLQELNNAVAVYAQSTKLTIDQLSGFQAVVFTDIGLEKAIELNNYCHNHQPPIAFIKAEVHGLFGSVFCDFGPAFTVSDVYGEDPCTGIIASISNGNPAEVCCVKDEKLKFQDRDMVVFSEVKGMSQLNDGKPRRIKKSDPYSFTLDENTTNFGAYEGGGIVTKVKQPIVLNFKPLKDAIIDHGDFCDSDFGKSERTSLLHLAFQALDKFVAGQGCFPKAGSEEDAQKLISIVRKLNENLVGDEKIEDEDIYPELLQQFSFGSRAVLNPMATIIGGIVGQEVIKACSGQFHPIFQFIYFDSVESLPYQPLEASDFRPLYQSRYDAQISVFGSKLQKKLEEAKVFVVGSGALGCELLKNLALMGVSCGKKGKLTITDDDVIEKNNLSSHFLFREGNIGQFKSTVAASAVASINQHLNIEAFQKCLGPGTKTVFDYAFWEKLDVVVKAFYKRNARADLAKGCWHFNKPYIESGNEGTRCATLVVIPHLTEKYDPLRVQPEKQAPKCTINFFPYKIDHCLTWARSEFEVLLEKRIGDVNAYLSNPSEYTSAMRKAGDSKARATLEHVFDFLDKEICESFDDCIKWARLRFEEYFANRIGQLILRFPEDAVESQTDEPFWSAPKRFPHPLQFSNADPTHLHFIMAASILCSETFGIAVPDWAVAGDSIIQLAQEVNKFKPICTTSQSVAASADDVAYIDDRLVAELEKCQKKLPKGFRMKPIQFLKDDGKHIDLISAMANMRARNYSIPEVDKLKAKLFAAGRIVPDIATSSAMASGFACLELYKVLDGGHGVFDYRNARTNLATSSFEIYEPAPAFYRPHREMMWTSWDRWVVIKKNPTIKQVFEWLAKKGLKGYSVSWVNCVLYNRDSTQDREDMKVVDLVKEVAKLEIPPDCRYIDVEIACVYLDDEDHAVHIPLVSIHF